ncbi:MAG: hypothetical protein HN816_00935 [Gammaproteobacteria bacterium]|nr:hypothetical protein [Gammaproteobacteria bacterium]
MPQIAYRYDSFQEASLLHRILGDENDSTAEILALSPEIKILLDSKIDSEWGPRYKLKMLRKLLFSNDELNIQYNLASTLTATDTFNARSGNCLSLTSLYIAAARHVDIDANFQTVAVEPTWNHDGGTMIRYEHIIATGMLPGDQQYAVDFLPEFVLDGMETAQVTDEVATAIYYNNIGAEHLIDGQPGKAIANIRRAIIVRPNYSDAWNNMGAAMRRAGHHDLAEFSYMKAISQDKFNQSALSNLTQLYSYLGRQDETSQYIDKVNRYRLRNPYYLYSLAQESIKNGHYQQALGYLKKSIRYKRNEPDFYIAMSNIYKELGDEENRKKKLALAKKYREGALQAPERRMNHRFWTDFKPDARS